MRNKAQLRNLARFLIVVTLLIIPLVIAGEFGYNSLSRPLLVPKINYSEVNVNNSKYWDGHAWSDTRWLNIDGGNANQEIDINDENLITTGKLQGKKVYAVGSEGTAELKIGDPNYDEGLYLETPFHEPGGYYSGRIYLKQNTHDWAEWLFDIDNGYTIQNNNMAGEYRWQAFGSTKMYLYSNGKLSITGDFRQYDNKKHYFGTGQDAEIYYNGSDLIINPQRLGDGKLIIKGGGIKLENNAEVKKIVTMDWYTAGMGGGGENYIYGRDADPSNDEYIIWTVYIPKDMKEGTDIKVKWRWCPTIDQTGDKSVRWRYVYNYAGNSGTIGNYHGWYYITEDLSTNEPRRTIHETEVTISGVEPGDFLSFLLYRDADSSEDTCEGDVFVFLNAYVEYTSNKLGEET